MAKRYNYTIKQELVAKFADALANPARVAICEFLGQRKSCYFGAIQDVLPLSKATVSQHLVVLKDVGLIQGEIVTPRVRYCIDKENWSLAREILSDFMLNCVTDATNIEEGASDCCDNKESSEGCCSDTKKNKK